MKTCSLFPYLVHEEESKGQGLLWLHLLLVTSEPWPSLGHSRTGCRACCSHVGRGGRIVGLFSEPCGCLSLLFCARLLDGHTGHRWTLGPGPERNSLLSPVALGIQTPQAWLSHEALAQVLGLSSH